LFVIYEWNAWWQFKLVRAMPEAHRLTARPGEHAQHVLDRCPPTATAFAFHVNATFSGKFPHERSVLIAGLEARGIVPINGAITDISKRWVQAQCAACGLPVTTAASEGDPDERLIVKTNHNYGGRSERLLAAADLTGLGVPSPSAVVVDPRAYPIVARRAIPGAWWVDPALTIERFIENRHNRIYRVSLAGRRFDVMRLINTRLLKKVDDSQEKVVMMCDRDRLARGDVRGVEAHVSAAVVRFVDAANLDFGSLDVIADDDGRAYILDVNTTPYGATNSLRRLLSIRRGLFELVADRAARVGRLAPKPDRAAWPTIRMLSEEWRRLKANLAPAVEE
jgi:hypothetical protein